NLLLSLTLSGFIVLYFAKSSPYAAKYNQAKSAVEVANSSAVTSEQQLTKAKEDYKAELDRINTQLKKMRDDLEARDKVLGQKITELSDLKKEKTKLDESVKKSQTEALARQNDVEQLRLTLEAEQKANVQLVRDNDKLRQARVASDIQRDTY